MSRDVGRGQVTLTDLTGEVSRGVGRGQVTLTYLTHESWCG